MDTKKVILWGVGLAAVGGLAYWLWKRSKTQPAERGAAMLVAGPTQPGNPTTVTPIVAKPPMNALPPGALTTR